MIEFIESKGEKVRKGMALKKVKALYDKHKAG